MLEVEKSVGPFFSIIVPVYNVAQYLKACLDSLLTQTFTDWECICVDDGATDESGAILDEFAARDKRIRVVHQQNRGVSAARNRALDLAHGAFVTFLDGDDIAYPWWLETFAHFQKSSTADLIRVKYPAYRPYGQAKPDLNAVPTTLFEQPQALLEWGWDTFCRDGYPFLYAVRRTCLDNVRFLTDVRLKEDILFDLALLPHLKRAIQCDVITYWYRCRAGSAVKRRAPQKETATRILHLAKTVEAQRDCLATAHADIRLAASWVILRDLVTLVIDHGAHELPTLLQHCCTSGALTLEKLPKRWQHLLKWAAHGTLWPICLYSRLSFYKWELIGWWKRP